MRQKIGIKTLEALTPENGKPAFLWDVEMPGFGAVVYPSGRKSYVIQYRTRKARNVRRMVLGNTAILRPAQAREMAREYLAQVAMGGDPAQEQREARQSATLGELWEEWTRAIERHVKPNTVKARASAWRRIAPTLGGMRADEIQRRHVEAFHAGLEATPSGANACIRALCACLQWAKGRGLVADNPAAGIRKYREESRQRLLSADELRRLAEALQTLEADGRLSAGQAGAVRLLLLTGCRKSEILGARWADVDFERRVLNLPDAKTGARPVLLNAAALAILDGLERRGPYICAGAPNKPIMDIRRAWLRICKKARLDNCNIHDLRHCFASTGAAQGLSLQIVGGLVGHKSEAMTARYSHLSESPLRAASEAIGDELAAFLSGPTADIRQIE